MSENLLVQIKNGIKWKINIYSYYRKVGLSKNVILTALAEIVKPVDRKTNLLKYKDLLRKHLFNTYQLMIPDDVDPIFFQEVLLKRIYSQFNDFIPEKGDIVLDVGAQCGDFSFLCSKVYNAGKVYAFEPLNANFKILERIVEINGISNIDTYNAAIGNSDGKLSLNIGGDGHMGTVLDTGTIEMVNVMRLDSKSFEKIDLLKIDVEGFEMEVLQGARNTINEHLPKLIIEIHTHLLKKEVINFLSEFGYYVAHEGEPSRFPNSKMDYVQNLFLMNRA